MNEIIRIPRKEKKNTPTNSLEHSAIGEESRIHIDFNQPQFHVFVQHDVKTQKIKKSKPAIKLALGRKKHSLHDLLHLFLRGSRGENKERNNVFFSVKRE